ncbi:hypothetical protein StrepF001_42290 [Streptomyces sp. F001]|uniref:hypothetical protein n=1 Tax=Streptomyces sp. F001 TaxID=1510026 RepID=UPI00101E76F2|nr:hypothetical protein [Streptomyces sp. F001]RZB13776.1 hypothetical protein StrepF001_42290 [Streptomyces sp. F001]
MGLLLDDAMTEWTVSEWRAHECHLRPVRDEASAGAVAAVLRIQPFRVASPVGDLRPALDVIGVLTRANQKFSRIVASVDAHVLQVLRWHARVELVLMRPDGHRRTATTEDAVLTRIDAHFDCTDTDPPDDPCRIEVRLWK